MKQSKRVWDREFETFTFHAHLWEWVLPLCVVWRWEACAHVSTVVVLHWNSEWNRSGWRCLWLPRLGVLVQGLALVLSVCIHSFAESGGTEGGAVAWARAVAGYKPLMSVFHYQMLWWHVVWQGYKTQVSTKCQTMQNFGSGDISKESHVSIA